MQHNRQVAFTLVELLVVLAIVLILVAILLSVFSSAKKSAKSTVALHRLSQFAKSSALYSTDYDDRYPVQNPFGQVEFFASGASAYEADPLKPYGMQRRMYFCDREPEKIAGRLPLAKLVSRFYFDFSEANGNWSWPFGTTPQPGTVIAYDTCEGEFPDTVSDDITWLYTTIDSSVKKVRSTAVERIYYQPDQTWQTAPQSPFSYLRFPNEPDPVLWEIK
jgi:prepilin-type N-terminal cleavage/methylation domain-containing protein